MTQPRRRKLIEVAMPLDVINRASVREKSIRHGHPSTLHLWWARRPLATCRAVLFAQLVDDPSGHPDRFPTPEAVETERRRLFGIMEELVLWENSTNGEVLERARAEIVACCGDDLPKVYDPFCGGGSIPLEAQRLGLPAYGSDLNPVAVMIGKAMIEIPPAFRDRPPVHPGIPAQNHYRNGEGLAEDIAHYGAWMRDRARERIGHLYPQVDLPHAHGGGQGTVIAWLWARTVPSPDPAFSHVQVPLASSFLVCSKKGKETRVEPIVDKVGKTIRYRVRTDGTPEQWQRAKLGTSAGKRQGFVCLISGAAMPYDYIRQAGQAGQMGQTLIAVVAAGPRGRVYVEPTREQDAVARAAEPDGGPEARLPDNTRDFKTPNYGMETFGDLFTNRQLLALNTFSDLVPEARSRIEQDAVAAGWSPNPTPLREGGRGATAYGQGLSVYLAFVVSRLADRGSSISTWDASRETTRNTFGRQAIPMAWDFAEANPFSASSGNWMAMRDWVCKAVRALVPGPTGASVQHDAQTVTYAQGAVISTDPPYYDNIAYADLSDFFYVWLRPALRGVFPDIFSTLAAPKFEELVASAYRHGDREAAEAFFLDGMKQTLANMARQQGPDLPATVYYAFKQKEIKAEGLVSTGWATFLQAVIEAGYAVVGTWPMRTEMSNRMVSQGANALANSVVLVCRRRPDNAELSTRTEFRRALEQELPGAIAELKTANITPADLPQAAIGPGIGIFSRYKAVLEANDDPMPVKTALQFINDELDKFMSNLSGEFDAETRFALTWFEQYGHERGTYGAAENLAKARNMSVEDVKNAGIIESAAGQVRILPRDELGPDPESPQPGQLHKMARPALWTCCQYLVRAHETDGEGAAARVLNILERLSPGVSEGARSLAHALYDVCENKRQDAAAAMPYNNMVSVWSEITWVASTTRNRREDDQTEMQV